MKAGMFALLLVALPACPSSSRRCDFTNCSGCCDDTGSCQPGIFPTACGTSGVTCQVCPSDSCEFGQCGSIGEDGGPLRCGPQNCSVGCCVPGPNVCLSLGAQNQSLCGNFGEVCFPCPAGEVCSNGNCLPQNCPANCTGCCDPSGACFPGQDPLNCGTGGVLCVSCPGGACQNGSCVGDGGCDSADCPLGCCSGSSCIDFGGQNDSECGGSGGACFSCVSGATCVQGICVGGVCDASNCQGCCVGASCIDVPLQRDFACGLGGAACGVCDAGLSCQSGQCLATRPPCSPTNCMGCCAATTCIPLASETNVQCGHGGAACSACAGITACSDAGVCD
jgi:hypothetical protein